MEQLLAIDLVTRDGVLPFGRDQPVDELLTEFLFDRRKFLQASAGAAAASVLGFRADDEAFAKAPFAMTQVPAYYRFKVGTFEVTAVTDGIISLPLSLFPAAGKTEALEVLAKAHRPENAPTAVNTYVINTGDKLILVDTGYGNMAGPDAGLLLDNLKAAGFDPAQFRLKGNVAGNPPFRGTLVHRR